jgi:hypothetical protein
MISKKLKKFFATTLGAAMLTIVNVGAWRNEEMDFDLVKSKKKKLMSI